MIVAIDSGTSKTRVVLLDKDKNIIAKIDKMVGARDTRLTGSIEYLKRNLEEMIFQVFQTANLPIETLELIVASGMITSELGLAEIPHLIAPIDKKQLAKGIIQIEANKLLSIDVPILLVPGVRNAYADDATLRDLKNIDFMRGEEVQSIAISERYAELLPLNLVVLSSHSKLIHINKNKEIVASCTTMSGQVYDCLVAQTLIGSAVADNGSEIETSGLTEDEIISIACDSVKEVGFLRSLMMPRFMQVLLKSNSKERKLFLNAVIAADDIQAFEDIVKLGCESKSFVLFGHEERCRLYEKIFMNKFGNDISIVKISDPKGQEDMTSFGMLLVLDEYLKMKKEECTCLR